MLLLWKKFAKYWINRHHRDLIHSINDKMNKKKLIIGIRLNTDLIQYICINLMAGFGKYPDIDRQIVAYLDPPQILSMSEVNRYFNQLAAVRRELFNQAQFDIVNALKSESDWLVQWHIRRNESKITAPILGASFAYANYPFTKFAIEKIKCQSRKSTDETVRKIVNDFKHIYKGKFAPAFLEYVENCIERTFEVKCADYHSSLRDICRMFKDLLYDKKYETAIILVNRNMHIKNISNQFKDMFRYHPEQFADLDDEFIDRLFDMLGIKLDQDDYMNAMQIACGIPTDTTFFALVSKYEDYINYPKLLSFACRHSSQSVVQWILTHIEQTHKVIRLNRPFAFACFGGKIERAQWLWNLSETNSEKYKMTDICKVNNYTFRIVCERGLLDVAKYLLMLGATNTVAKINIVAFIRDCFGQIVFNYNFIIAEWLLEIGLKTYGKINLLPWKDQAVSQSDTTIYRWLRNLPQIYTDNIDWSTDNVIDPLEEISGFEVCVSDYSGGESFDDDY